MDEEGGEEDSELELEDSSKKKAPRRHHPRVDIVSKLLSIVETQALMGENCSPGTDLNLGEKVVNRYAQVRWVVIKCTNQHKPTQTSTNRHKPTQTTNSRPNQTKMTGYGLVSNIYEDYS